MSRGLVLEQVTHSGNTRVQTGTCPLPPAHPLWTMPQVLISPHYAGEVVNASALPAERFARNLRRSHANQELEGVVNLDWGY